MTIVGAVSARHIFFRAWRSCWLVLFMLCASSWSYAAYPWRVVILPGADPTQPSAHDQIRALRSTLIATAPDGVRFYTGSPDDLRFDSAGLMPVFLALVKKKYEHGQVDIVIGRAATPMAEVSGAPIYGRHSTYLDHGLTTGSVISVERDGQLADALAGSIIPVKTAAPQPTTAMGPSHCVADVGRIEKSGLQVSNLPEDCELINPSPSLWPEDGGTVLTAVALLTLQATTIAALLWQRRGRRIAEDEATVRLGELARAARFASAGELSASIAHEVGQPLGAILSNAEAAGMMLENPEPDIAELHLILADVRRDALRANQVVQRLRSMLQKQPVEYGPLDLDATITEALVLVEPEGRQRRITIESNLDTDSAQIMGDRVQLQQIVLNLVINAMDAMQDTDPPGRMVSISTRVAEGGIELGVADRGQGIPTDAKKKLFDSLYSTKPHGMGLGLSIVRTIVTSHGGRISVEARSGGGSLFSVWLPAAPEGLARRTLHGFGYRNTVAAASKICHTTQGGHP